MSTSARPSQVVKSLEILSTRERIEKLSGNESMRSSLINMLEVRFENSNFYPFLGENKGSDHGRCYRAWYYKAWHYCSVSFKDNRSRIL